MDGVDVKLLRYFMAVADMGSFSRAAKRLNMAQSHLSRQIIRLETVLDQRLFVRGSRHMELTDVGEILRQEANFITARLDRFPELMKEAAADLAGSLCIGFTKLESRVPVVSKIIGEVAREDQCLSLRFRVESHAGLLNAVADRQIHAAFARMPSRRSPELRFDELVREPFQIVLAHNHRLAARERIDLADLADEPFILCERALASEVYDEIVAACGRVGISPRIVFQAPEPASALSLASAGVGIAILPSLVCSQQSGVRFAVIAESVAHTVLALITRVDEHSAGVNLLRERARTIAAMEIAGAER